jgi:hypothetical protein
MTSTQKTKAAQYGLLLGTLGFLTGGMLLCDCPGWFLCAGIAAAFPALWGAPLVRLAGVTIFIASFACAIVPFRHERALAARVQQIRNAARTPQP